MLSLVVLTLVVGTAAQAPPPSPPAPSGIVEGRVLEEGTQAPVAGAQVMLMAMPAGPTPAMPMTTAPPSASTDADGRFRFSGIAAGRYRVTAQKAGFALPLDAAMRAPVIAVAADAPVPGLTLVMQRGAVIAGRVIDAEGEPVVNARVMPMRPRPELPPTASAEARAMAARFAGRYVGAGPGASTDDRGEFRVHSLPAGEYVLQVMPIPTFGGPASPMGASTAFVPTFHPGTTSPDEAQPIAVAAGQAVGDLTIRMAKAPVFPVAGTVVDESGAPVADAQVRVVPTDPANAPLMMAMPGSTRTDARGAFTLPQVRSGSYTLIAVAPVVIARDPAGSPGTGAMASGFTAGLPGPMVTTETRNGVTVRYRDDDGTKVQLTVGDAAVGGLRLVVRRPPSQ